jgi:hypothetical protein
VPIAARAPAAPSVGAVVLVSVAPGTSWAEGEVVAAEAGVDLGVVGVVAVER